VAETIHARPWAHGQMGSWTTTRQAGSALKTRAGGGHLGPARHLGPAGGDRRALLRGLQRGAPDSQARRGRPRRRRRLRPGPRQRRAALGGLARDDRPGVTEPRCGFPEDSPAGGHHSSTGPDRSRPPAVDPRSRSAGSR
jgi:hypothetical protein